VAYKKVCQFLDHLVVSAPVDTGYIRFANNIGTTIVVSFPHLQ